MVNSKSILDVLLMVQTEPWYHELSEDLWSAWDYCKSLGWVYVNNNGRCSLTTAGWTHLSLA